MSLRNYFLARTGKAMPWSLDKPCGGGQSVRREYLIEINLVDRDVLTATVTSMDYDRSDSRLTRVPVMRGTVSMPIGELADPAAVLEEIARQVDPTAFRGVQRTGISHTLGDLEHRLQQLLAGGGLGDKDIPAIAESAERVRRFISDTPGLLKPDLFSSSDGTVRGRWQDGASRTLWVIFPGRGPLGWTISYPRDGDTGMVRVNGRMLADKDLAGFAACLGIRIRN